MRIACMKYEKVIERDARRQKSQRWFCFLFEAHTFEKTFLQSSLDTFLRGKNKSEEIVTRFHFSRNHRESLKISPSKSLDIDFYRALNRVKFGSIGKSILSSRKDYVKQGLYRRDGNSILVLA